jgi:hypothetical protein
MPKFRLRSKIFKLDDVPEAYRGAYVQRDGAFHLDPAKLEEVEFDDRAGVARAFKDERVRAAALKAGVRKEEIEDVMQLTASRFDLDDQGVVVVLGADGRASGTSVEDFFGKTYREQRPCYYGQVSEGDSRKQISRAGFDKMDAQQKAAFFREGGQLVD